MNPRSKKRRKRKRKIRCSADLVRTRSTAFPKKYSQEHPAGPDALFVFAGSISAALAGRTCHAEANRRYSYRQAVVDGYLIDHEPLTRDHFKAFEKAYGTDPHGKAKRTDEGETGRFRCFTREFIKERGENLDISWLKDDDAPPDSWRRRQPPTKPPS